MKTSYFLYFLFAYLMCFPFCGFAQEWQTIYAKRKWYLPDHTVVQFAGNIGFLAVGPGYSLAQDKINLDILYGYTPSFEAETSIHTLTGKFIYSPWQNRIKPGYIWEPLKFGAGVSYSLGSQFYTTLPRHYPDGYYFWPTSFRLTPFVGTSISKAVGNSNSLIKQVQGYTEAGTHDLAILSLTTNKALSPWDIISFAFGVKLKF
ncbi:hypothetical protein AHMF7605_27085 [Adhaeribacter arboris]|uniref:Outer membrane protein beta-barrel domain-containing protein n=1 Tax=Adhaeribacter arboris TaxID=2072846 RepID=A0A2T2YN13_9BACT|nr:hypothetical protein [Adhaeribacter arboris]PSR56900.1 hypothetical protein AHMF7605_27085 [Adhaeribacter arboris]